MNANLIAPEVIQRFAGSLLHFIWQGAAIALMTAAGLRLLRHRSAEARYAFAIGGLTCMLAAPLFTVVFYSQTGAVTQRLIVALNLASTSLEAGRSTATALHTSLWAQRILLTWCVGVVVFAARLVMGWRFSWELVRSAEQVLAPGVVEIFDSVREKLGLTRPIRLLAHVRLDSAIVVGWLRPVVLLPVSLISGFTPEQLSGILAHELAHIRRHDFIVNILQRCVESILFYHPAVWWLSKRIRAEREHCCDDIAIRLCGSRKIYAEALIEMERARQPRPILSVAAADGVVLQRFRRVLGMSTSVVDWQSAVGTLLFLGVWIVVGMWQSASMLQATPTTAATPAIAAAAILPAATTPAVAEGVNAIAAILTAQPVAEPTPAAEPPQATVATSNAKGSIQGVVTRAGTNQPIPGAFVAIENAPFDPDALAQLLKFWAARGVTMNPQAPGQSDEKYFQTLMDNIAAKGLSPSLPENQIAIAQFRDTNTRHYSAMADVNGQFTIKDVAPGQYTLEADHQGFFDIPGRQAIADVEGGKPVNVSVQMLAGGTITGKVKNAAGRLVPNANVTAYQITYLNGKIIPQAQSSQTTDDRGEYRLFWLPPGDYVVLVDPPTYPLPVLASAMASAGPRGGAQPSGPMAAPQFMRTFYPRSLTTTDAVVLAVKSGDQLSGMDITVQKATTYKISGEIHAAAYTGPALPARGRGANADPNAPVRIQIYLGLEYRDPAVIDMRSTNLGGTVPSAGSAILESSADGLRATFEVNNVLPGQYYLVPRVTQNVPAGTGIFNINRVAVDVDDKDVRGLAIELVPSWNVDGALTIDGRAPGNTTVRVALSAVGNPSPTYQGISARTAIPRAEDGTFTLLNIPQTRYHTEMGAGLPSNLYVSDVRMGAVSVYDSGFEVGKEPLAPLQVSLRSGAATVEGIVRDGANKPVPNATVVVVPPDARRENHELYKTAKSDASGKYTLRGIAPGNYKIFAFEGLTGGEFYNARFLSKHEFRGKPINVAQGGATTESLTVIESN